MSDRLEKLEAELSALRPHPLASSVLEGIERSLAGREARRPWADRMLVASMCGGAIAACVIVATLVLAPGSSIPQQVAAQSAADLNTPRFGDYQLALARADPTWSR